MDYEAWHDPERRSYSRVARKGILRVEDYGPAAAAAQYLVSAFRRLSRLDPSCKLGSFILAYSAFRMGYCKMALSGTQDPQERLRFRNAYLQYREEMLLAARSIARVS